MKDFGIYDKVQAGNADARCYQDALPTMWDERPTGAETCCRLVCKTCYQETTDKDDTRAPRFTDQLERSCTPRSSRGLRTTPCSTLAAAWS